MSEFEYNQIKNKYDIHNVKATIDEFMKHQMKNKYCLEENTSYEYIQFALGASASVFILKSYFHKTSFPDDKWIIIGCTLGYLVFSYLIDFYNAWVYGSHFAVYPIKGNQAEVVIRNSTKNNKDKKGLAPFLFGF